MEITNSHPRPQRAHIIFCKNISQRCMLRTDTMRLFFLRYASLAAFPVRFIAGCRVDNRIFLYSTKTRGSQLFWKGKRNKYSSYNSKIKFSGANRYFYRLLLEINGSGFWTQVGVFFGKKRSDPKILFVESMV